MTVAQIHRQSVRQLRLQYPEEAARALSYALLSHCSGRTRTQLHAFPETALPEATVARIQGGVAELLAHRPLQYITGVTSFCGLPMEVNGAVLIPRPETEELVQWVLNSHRWAAGDVLIDLCTGSGCVAVALAHAAPSAAVVACDISREALDVAQRNARRNGAGVRFLEYDVLSGAAWPIDAEAIVCNPPYVRQSEKASMEPNVLLYEPHAALFVDDSDPLVFYRALARFAQQHLKANGLLFMEINEALGRETAAVFTRAGFASTELRRDLNGKDRMLKVRKT
jgi:release factor glutamine methyltransferase